MIAGAVVPIIHVSTDEKEKLELVTKCDRLEKLKHFSFKVTICDLEARQEY
jgi:hypothetical protein